MSASAPPNAIVIKMTDADVHENLVHIASSLDRIRSEAYANMGATDEQKQDYLRLTGELASCVQASIIGNDVLSRHYEYIKGFLKNDSVLLRYDPSQEEFWTAREPRLKDALVHASAVFFKNDFNGETQAYHLLQAFKYLGVNGNRDEVYETILPVNSMLNDHSLQSPDISRFLAKKMFSSKNDGLGIKVSLDAQYLVKSLEQTGAMYVDLPKDQYPAMKKLFPKTTKIKEGNEEYTRVIFTGKDAELFVNVFDRMKGYATIELGDAENSLVKKVVDFYGFGKKFLEELTKKIGISQDTLPVQIGLSKSNKKSRGTIDNMVLELDASAAIKGENKTQDQWIDYWNNVDDGRVFASMPDFYASFKNLKIATETGSDEEKKASKKLLSSIRKDFTDTWLASSTRLQYGFNEENALEGRIIHHHKCKNTQLINESLIDIPVYRGTLIDEVVGSAQGLEYLQTYFDTTDDANKIIETLEFISGKARDKMQVWTADMASRKSNSDRAAFLNYYDGNFHIDGDNYLGHIGRSRGARISSAARR